MRSVYIGVGVLIVLVVAVFGIMRWQENAQAERVSKMDIATPSPWPSPSPKPIQLHDGGTIGAPYFQQGNSPAGGHGDPVDGIQCLGMEAGALHIHAHLALFVNGKQYQIPKLLGGTPTASGGCLYWIHTHDASGIIHIEAPQVVAPEGNGFYTLGDLFDIWGQPLGPNGVASFTGPVTAYVDGQPYTGDLHDLSLTARKQIVLEVGQPVVPPPNYQFPAGD